MAGLLALLLMAGQALAAEYRVVKVRRDDVLNVRERPDPESKALATLPPDATGITVLRRSGRWAEIEAGDIRGWVNGFYLSVAAASARPKLPGSPVNQSEPPPPPAAAPPPDAIAADPPETFPVPRGGGSSAPRIPAAPPPPTPEPVFELPPGAVPATAAATTFFPDRLTCVGADPAWTLTIIDGAVTQSGPEGTFETGRLAQLQRKAVHRWEFRFGRNRGVYERNLVCTNPATPEPFPIRLTVTGRGPQALEACCRAQ